jgi:uncharacterized membrane protein
MPEGFTGYFKSGSYEVSKVHAAGNAEDTIASFQVTVPKEASQGVHEIRLKAVSDSGLEDELVLELTVSWNPVRAISMWNIRIRKAPPAPPSPTPPPSQTTR